MKPLDLTNKRFGKLTALVRVENNRQGKAVWSCLCDCGNYCIVNTSELTRGRTASCGCNRSRHGMSKTRFHNIWISMRNRCNNPNCEFYYCYGGRGIDYDKSGINFTKERERIFGYGYEPNLNVQDSEGNWVKFAPKDLFEE